MIETMTNEAASSARRLILCFDGTWNTSKDETNVSRIYSAIADKHSGCGSQLKFYDEGVGTTWGSRIAGGALGWGLNENVLEGYCWLTDNYLSPSPDAKPLVDPSDPDKEQFENGDQIFLFGFSRGAFTARSLAGLINACGLLKREAGDGPTTIDSQLVMEAWKLYSKRRQRGLDIRTQPECQMFRKTHSHNVKVRFIGVWDTVGALGVPKFGSALLPTRSLWYGFHDTNLGRVVENAYQAVAIDEHRLDYAVSLWSKRHPIGTQKVEQRWFPGAHANVGGGYEDDLLPELSLHWITKLACDHGLRFAPCDDLSSTGGAKKRQEVGDRRCEKELRDFALDGTELLVPVRDSFKEFMFGVYQAGSIVRSMSEAAGRGLKGIGTAFGLGGKNGRDAQTQTTANGGMDGRYYRPMLVTGVGEVIDPLAQEKWEKDARYRPVNLAHAGRNIGPVAHEIDTDPLAEA